MSLIQTLTFCFVTYHFMALSTVCVKRSSVFWTVTAEPYYCFMHNNRTRSVWTRPGFKYYSKYLNYFHIHFEVNSHIFYLLRQVIEYWNLFGNTLGTNWHVFDESQMHWLKYTPMHLTQVFENSIWNKYLKILSNSRLSIEVVDSGHIIWKYSNTSI